MCASFLNLFELNRNLEVRCKLKPHRSTGFFFCFNLLIKVPGECC